MVVMIAIVIELDHSFASTLAYYALCHTRDAQTLSRIGKRASFPFIEMLKLSRVDASNALALRAKICAKPFVVSTLRLRTWPVTRPPRR